MPVPLSFREWKIPVFEPGFAVKEYPLWAETLYRKPDTMRWNCATSLSYLTSLLLLAACENPSAPASRPADEKQLPGAAILGIEWVQQRSTDTIYFVGSFLTLTLAGDSAVLTEDHYTDEILCRITDSDTLCTNGGWENRFVGSYAMDDSLLTLSLTFAGTTANNETPNPHAASIVTVSRYALDAGEPLKLTLTGIGDGNAFPGRKTIKMAAKPKSP
jgi:hypothetical protein